MSIYANVRDYTMQQPGSSPGVTCRKACSVCNQHRELRGGSLFSKLRLWRCASCTDRAAGMSLSKLRAPAQPEAGQ